MKKQKKLSDFMDIKIKPLSKSIKTQIKRIPKSKKSKKKTRFWLDIPAGEKRKYIPSWVWDK